MIRTSFLFSAAALLLLSACNHETLAPASMDSDGVLKLKAVITPAPQGDPLTQDELDRAVIGKLEAQNDFHWEWMDLRTLWSATQYNDHSVSIGYEPADAGDISEVINRIDIHSGAWKQVHDALIDLVLTTLNKGGGRALKLSDILVEDDAVLPILTFKLTDKETITALYNLRNVRYIEPLDYWPAVGEDRSSSGCSPSTYALNAADYSSITPNALLPWNFNNHTIPGAWINAQGLGITVGVIDAGISSSQPLLGSDFNNGDSNVGRTVSTAYTYGTSAFTSCTHGSSMCSMATGPRNTSGTTSGVAYKANLAFVRGANDVVLDESAERTGVKNALVQLSDNAQVRVISLSMGTPFSYSILSDGVNYAYGAGKLLFCAAGTSFSWTSWWGVIYPAAYSNCVAVTGVKENGSKCATCHDGSQVDLTICMERTGDSNRNSLALPASGTTPTYIGGSSIATSTTAGIAALVWSAHPTATRAQVLNCLTSTAQFYPTPNSSKGYGNINAQAAVNCALAL